MKDSKSTSEKLNNLSKSDLIDLYLQQQNSLQNLQQQNHLLLKQIEELQNKIDVLLQRSFGRKTEKEIIPPEQLRIDLDTLQIINEAEAEASPESLEENKTEEVIIPRKVRPKGKRKKDLSRLELVVDPTVVIPDAKLKDMFPKGYTRLDDYVYTDIEYVPSKTVAHEHHLAVYAGKHDEGVIRAQMPERLLKNSVITPSMAAYVINEKYVNALPLNRISEEFKRNDLDLSKQVLAGWMIKLTKRYLHIVYKAMHKEILKSRLIHCDETPFKLIHDGKENPNSKCYMWVYHSYERYGSPAIYLYEYHPARNTKVLQEFLGNYQGVLVTDGYQVYHTAAKQDPKHLIVAGCWAHARRKFAELVKSLDGGKPTSQTAQEAVKRISEIYHADNQFKGKSEEEILGNRKNTVAPLVDSYFEWVKKQLQIPIDKGGGLYGALSYSVNQEQFLREFLTDPIIPMDNNDAERSIRKFCVGKHSWHIIDSPEGAQSSAMLYSIAETAKANGLKPYEYFKYVFETILSRQSDPDSEYLKEILPWSNSIPDSCRMKIQ